MNNTINTNPTFGARLVINPNVKASNAQRLNSLSKNFENATKGQKAPLYCNHGAPKFPGSMAYVITPGTSEAEQQRILKNYSERFSDDFLTLNKDAKEGIDIQRLFMEPDNNKLLAKLVEIYNKLLG